MLKSLMRGPPHSYHPPEARPTQPENASGQDSLPGLFTGLAWRQGTAPGRVAGATAGCSRDARQILVGPQRQEQRRTVQAHEARAEARDQRRDGRARRALLRGRAHALACPPGRRHNGWQLLVPAGPGEEASMQSASVVAIALLNLRFVCDKHSLLHHQAMHVGTWLLPAGNLAKSQRPAQVSRGHP